MDNYTQIPNWMMAKLYRADGLTFREVKVLLFLIRKLYGFHKASDKIPYSQIVEATGIDRSDVIRTVKSLEDKKVISVRRKGHCINIIRIKGSGDSPTTDGGENTQKLVGKSPPSKENQKSVSSVTPLVEANLETKRKYSDLMEGSEDDEYE